MVKSKKKIIHVSIIFTVITILAVQSFSCMRKYSLPYMERNYKNKKNVILLIPDGMSIADTTIARLYKGKPLALDEIASGLVKTYWASGPITDSAPASTAMATGFKTEDNYLGVLPDSVSMPGLTEVSEEDKRKPVASVLEGAKLKGLATGLVATLNVQHATPAGFSSHYPDRSRFDIIAEQQVYNNIDVVLGAGSTYLMPTRPDGEDLVSVLKSRGYDYVTSIEGMNNSRSRKIWGMFSEDAMAYDMDRDTNKEPSISEMTKKAIDVLSKDKDGFFLLVEGSKIDWASHANDPVGVISDVLAFDDAVKAALDYAKEDKNTVVIACADHGNGGMSIGSRNTDATYSSNTLDDFIAPLKRAKLTGEGLEEKIFNRNPDVSKVMYEYYGISDLTDEEKMDILFSGMGSLNTVVGPMISKRANIGWTTTGHTGEDVVLYTYPNNKNDSLTGVVDNTDIAKYIADVLNIDLMKVNQRLFIDAKKEFEKRGASVSLNSTDPYNLVLEVKKDAKTICLPVNKDIAIVNGKEIRLMGVTVNNGTKTYVSIDALNLIM